MKELLKHGKRDAPVSLSEVITGSTIDGPSSIDQMLDSAVFTFKAELRKITKRNLLEMALSQREKYCLLGGHCPFLLEYRCIRFCISEILGQGCQGERQRLDSVQQAQSESEGLQTIVELPVGTWVPGIPILGRGSGCSQE